MSAYDPKLRALIEKRHGTKPCAVEGCWKSVYRLSKYCREHWNRDRRAGHPLGFAIRYAEIAPYVTAAGAFIERNRRHPAVEHALSFIRETLLIASQRRFNVYGDPYDALSPWARYCRTYFVDAADLLAVLLGMYAHREARPDVYRYGDRYFAIQMADRVIRSTSKAQGKERGGMRLPWVSRGYFPVKVRLSFARLVQDHLRTFPIIAAQHIVMDMAKASAAEEQRRAS